MNLTRFFFFFFFFTFQFITCSVVFILLPLLLLLQLSKQSSGNPLRKLAPTLFTMPKPTSIVRHYPQTKQIKLFTKAGLFVKVEQNGGISAVSNCSDDGSKYYIVQSVINCIFKNRF